jgi:type I restriction enzyme S subunit
MTSEWRTIRAADFIDFNPRLSLKKGDIATKVAMDKLKPFTKKIPETEKAEFNGGAKFCNGDTVMARITPCLENGKTAYVDMLDDGEIGFGSTEFIVMRAKKGISDPQFVYYTAINPVFRNVAIKSMVGSSGRQRVQQSVLEELELSVPDLDEQRRIGDFLARIDEKIALNDRINDNLADLLQTIYQERFGNDILAVNQGVLSDICSYSRDKVAVSELNVITYFSTENMLSGKAGSTEATSLPTTSQTTACHKGDTLISNIRPYFKKIVYCEDKCGCSTDVLCFTPSQPCYSAYLFSTLYADKFFAFMVAGSKGTKMPRGDKQQIMTYPVVLPSEEELAGFNTIASPLLEQIYSNRAENKRLSILRDTLLPKLMSGEINVSAVQL